MKYCLSASRSDDFLDKVRLAMIANRENNATEEMNKLFTRKRKSTI